MSRPVCTPKSLSGCTPCICVRMSICADEVFMSGCVSGSISRKTGHASGRARPRAGGGVLSSKFPPGFVFSVVKLFGGSPGIQNGRILVQQTPPVYGGPPTHQFPLPDHPLASLCRCWSRLSGRKERLWSCARAPATVYSCAPGSTAPPTKAPGAPGRTQ